jgi:hypothetical protein
LTCWFLQHDEQGIVWRVDSRARASEAVRRGQQRRQRTGLLHETLLGEKEKEREISKKKMNARRPIGMTLQSKLQIGITTTKEKEKQKQKHFFFSLLSLSLTHSNSTTSFRTITNSWML